MRRSDRRRFLRDGLALAGLGLLAGCGLPPLPGRPPARAPTIGVLTQSTMPGIVPAGFIAALREGLRGLGRGGDDVDLQVRPAQRPEQYTAFAAELARLGPAVFVADTVAAVRAVRAAAPTAPVVFVNIGDPVGAGLVASLARPGGDVTGLSSVSPQLGGKRLQLLRDCRPAMSRVAVLRNPDEPGTALEYAAAQAAAGALGLGLQGLELRADADVPPALEAARAWGAEALLIFSDPLMLGNRGQIMGFALRQRWPAASDNRVYVEQRGALLAFGPSIRDQYRRAATYVDKILNGTKPAELPVEQPTAFELVVNLGTAAWIGLDVPQSVLTQATEVIQ